MICRGMSIDNIIFMGCMGISWESPFRLMIESKIEPDRSPDLSAKSNRVTQAYCLLLTRALGRLITSLHLRSTSLGYCLLSRFPVQP